MDVDAVLLRLGGVATRTELVTRCGRAAVDAALSSRRIETVGRGRYALPTVGADLRMAHGMSGVLSHASAALGHGWAVLRHPDKPHVTVPRTRRVAAAARRDAVVHWSTLDAEEEVGGMTTARRTLADVLRAAPFDEALAVADSVLRSGRSHAWVVAVADEVRGRGAARARRAALAADPAAANPFESGLRAQALDAGLEVRAQVWVEDSYGRFLGRPDLVDVERRLVLEADSFQWHGSRSGLVRDAQRYNGFVVAGWKVLRFTWEDVVAHPDRTRDLLRSYVQQHAKVLPLA
ncbi:endonuclease domain-containing protein [Nocardioides yefusunii]|uniref:Endonuclease domain-containing protein n=1 Tax=Nocardioides yefusunii TaxID=2500546 RepID=A0ABW1QZV6_9ACTN|nr:DUF559 domain-containing protein [Nocardioides yefusunii]